MKPNRGKVLLLNLLVVVFNMLQAQQDRQQKFEAKLTELPFTQIAETHEIDRRCPATGKEDRNIYHYAQNAEKNNFGAKGIPVALSINDFTHLQQASEKQIESGRIVLQGKYPEDRTRLQNLIKVRGQFVGEGSVVSLQAYVFSARYANTKFNKDSDGKPAQGEAVNCDNPELDWNDIHIALSASTARATDECTTVTAEISPHYRPALWSRFHDGQNQSVEELVPGLLKGHVLKQPKRGQPLMVRLTGPLFYDASHQPCVFSGGKIIERHSPERRSIWEIHPIYRVQVFHNHHWVELDRWAK
jgi:hypothetical protein